MNQPTTALRASVIPILPVQAVAKHTVLRKYYFQWQRARTRALLFNASRSALKACVRPALEKHMDTNKLNNFNYECRFSKKSRQFLGSENLIRIARKSLFILATISFLTMVTELALTLHLSSHKHHGYHDSDHCPICQQLLVTSGKFITVSEPSLPNSNLQKDNVKFQSQFYVTAFHFEPFGPRPPPAAFQQLSCAHLSMMDCYRI